MESRCLLCVSAGESKEHTQNAPTAEWFPNPLRKNGKRIFFPENAIEKITVKGFRILEPTTKNVGKQINWIFSSNKQRSNLSCFT